MTVGELIHKLQQVNKDAEVVDYKLRPVLVLFAKTDTEAFIIQGDDYDNERGTKESTR